MNTQTLGQNRIDYIVYHHLEAAGKLIYSYGYEIPEFPEDIAAAVKELIRLKGKQVIKALLELHPDKKAIEALYKSKNKKPCSACKEDAYSLEDNYCGSCGYSNYNDGFVTPSFDTEIASYSDEKLKQEYTTALEKSNASPTDTNLSEKVQQLWDALRKRQLDKRNSPEKKENEKFISKDQLMLLCAVFVTGIVVGTGLRFSA